MINQDAVTELAGGGEGSALVFCGPSRRKRLVNFTIMRGMQWRMLVKVWLIVAFSLLVAGSVFYYYTDMRVDESYRQFHMEVRNFRELLFPVLASGLLASMILGGVAALMFPHQFAGPLYRIETDLAEIGTGNLRHHVQLRRGDDVEELALAVNAMAEGLRCRVQAIDATARAIRTVTVLAQPQDGGAALQDVETLSCVLLEQIAAFDL